MLIDISYFNGELNIPNSDSESVIESLTWLINKYEPEMLQKLFGYSFYKALVAGLNPSADTAIAPDETESASTDEATVTDDIEQRWLDLRDGCEYTDIQNKTQRWRGLIDKVSDTQKQSLIANYVYYWYLVNNQSQTTGIGETATKPTGSESVSSAHKAVRAWKDMIDWIYELYDYMQNSRSKYPEYDASILTRSLYCIFKKINSFGI